MKQIRHLNYPDRLRKLNLPTFFYLLPSLQSTDDTYRGDMIEVFKILHNTYDDGIIQKDYCNFPMSAQREVIP